MTACPICELANVDSSSRADADATSFQCQRCGSFVLEEQFLSYGSSEAAAWPTDAPGRHRVSAALRAATDRGVSTRLMAVEDLRDLVSNYPGPRDVIEQLELLLLHIHQRLQGEGAGGLCVLDPEVGQSVVGARSREELSFCLDQLAGQGLVEGKTLNGRKGAGPVPPKGYRPTLKGWERLRELTRHRRDGTKAFVAMWFNEEATGAAFDKGIKPALENRGFRPCRVDNVEHNDKICDRIVAEIRESALVIADFTGHRGGVYFEAGLAKGLGIPLIWTCRDNGSDDEDGLSRAHFDTRQYNHITWKTGEEDKLRQRLEDRIRATISPPDVAWTPVSV
ncbi:MAG: hypothetical protein IPG96_01205 [Proteobacteria bacterium]|nr:hypothetical protein [Pseudomonadota bacterium]